MKKRVSKLNVFAWMVTALSAVIVFIWSGLPGFFENTIQNILVAEGANLQGIKVEKITPWGTRIKDLNIRAKEGNLTVARVDMNYDPVSLTQGNLHAFSLTSPQIEVCLPLMLERIVSMESRDNDKNIHVLAEEVLANPPLRHFRMRDASVFLDGVKEPVDATLEAEGDFHPNLAQLRMDGNLSGFSWLGDLTLVQEGKELFLGASLQFPDLSFLTSAIKSLVLMIGEDDWLDFADSIRLESGAAKGQWTGRLVDDEMMDQFLDLNISDLVMERMGFSVNIPQAVLFVTPHNSSWIDTNFYANLNWGGNLAVKGLKVSTNLKNEQLDMALRVQHIITSGILPKSEMVGLIINGIEFAKDEDGKITGLHRAQLRFSALHLEEGLFNLYDGEIDLEWLGEDRFKVELRKANGSLPTLGVNLHKLSYSGEIALGILPQLDSIQSLSVDEAFLGEDQSIKDLDIEFRLDSAERIEISELGMSVDDFEFVLNPANLIIELAESSEKSINISLLESELEFPSFDDFSIRNMITNLKFNSFDPLETNGSQSIRFSLNAGEQVLENGEINLEVLPTGEKIINTVSIDAFGGEISLEETKLGQSLEGEELNLRATALDSQEILSLFDEIDAQMEGNLSGELSVRNDPFYGWDFYGGALSLDPVDSAKLSLNTKGLLTDGLDPESSEFDNMYLMEKALEDLNLEALSIHFRVMDNGERLVEMNVRGDSEVDGKNISIEYRPKIVGGLDALFQQADLSAWGISP